MNGKRRRCPLDRSGIFDIPQVIHSALDQHAPRTDGFGILGHKRPLLREGEGERVRRIRRTAWEVGASYSQNCRALSIRMVTGPSFTSSTRIMAWNSPVATGNGTARNSLTRSS